MENSSEKTPAYSYYALAVLMFVYVMNFLDRQIIYILFPLIKKEMAFSDTQLALLGGTAFAIFYTILGIPFGRIADKSSRTKMIAAGLATWSLFSGLTGFADSFWTLFFCRLMVGVGEATLGPAAISLLADYFPPTKRGTVTGIYSMGIAIGAGLAAIFGGYLSQFGWRNAFFTIGFPGLAVAVLVFLLKEPARSVRVSENTDVPNGDWKKLISNKAFIFLCLGYGFFGLATNNISLWGAVFFNRLYATEIPIYGYWAGIITLCIGIPAMIFGGYLADYARRKARGGRMIYSAGLSFVSIPCWLVVLYTNNPAVAIAGGAILLLTGLAWLGAAAADAIEISGANLRGVAVAIYFFTVTIFAYIIGANIIGFLSDKLGATENPQMLRYALLICPLSCLLAVICLAIGSKLLNKEQYNQTNLR